jgi:hypothetical protein
MSYQRRFVGLSRRSLFFTGDGQQAQDQPPSRFDRARGSTTLFLVTAHRARLCSRALCARVTQAAFQKMYNRAKIPKLTSAKNNVRDLVMTATGRKRTCVLAA